MATHKKKQTALENWANLAQLSKLYYTPATKWRILIMAVFILFVLFQIIELNGSGTKSLGTNSPCDK